MDFDVEGLYNIHKLQESGNSDDQKRLLNLLNTLSSSNGWPICASILAVSSLELPNPYTMPNGQKSALIFLCCRAIEDFLGSDFIWHWLKQLVNPSNCRRHPRYIEAKASQLISVGIVRYYPKYWSSVFDDLVSFISESSGKLGSLESLYISVEIVLDALTDLDAGLMSRDVQLTTSELERANEIKDAMRISSVNSLMRTCYQLMDRFLNCGDLNATIIKKMFDTIGLYASWVNLELVAGSEWVSLINRLLEMQLSNESSALVRSGIYSYLNGIVNKGMSTVDKLQLVTGIWDQLGLKLSNNSLLAAFLEHSETLTLDECQIEFLCCFSRFIDSIGIQLITIYRSLHEESNCSGPNGFSSNNGNDNGTTSSLMALALENIESKLNLAICLFENKEQEIDQNLIPFLRAYLCFLKGSVPQNAVTPNRKSRHRNTSSSVDSPGAPSCPPSNGTSACTTCGLLELTETRLFLVKRLLFALINKLKSLPLSSGQEDEDDDNVDYRHELRTLIGNVILLDPGFVLGLIHQLFKHAQNILTSGCVSEDSLVHIDVTLNLFYLFGEVSKAPKNDHFAQAFVWHETMINIMAILCSDTFARLPHWILQLQYFELMARYERYFVIEPNHLFCVMLAFVDDRGLHCSYNLVRVRCSYLISRLVKAHRKTLAPHVEQLMSQFSDLLQLPLEPDAALLDNDQPSAMTNGRLTLTHQAVLGITEQGFLYEAIAQLISVGGDAMPDSVERLFLALLNPILVQYAELVTKFVNEDDAKMAKGRGLLIKQATDLIT